MDYRELFAFQKIAPLIFFLISPEQKKWDHINGKPLGRGMTTLRANVDKTFTGKDLAPCILQLLSRKLVITQPITYLSAPYWLYIIRLISRLEHYYSSGTQYVWIVIISLSPVPLEGYWNGPPPPRGSGRRYTLWLDYLKILGLTF